VVFDTDDAFAVSADRLYYRHPVSPYLGEHLRGKVKATYLRGKLVFDNGAFEGAPSGREDTLQRKEASTLR
jgi:allantoinase